MNREFALQLYPASVMSPMIIGAQVGVHEHLRELLDDPTAYLPCPRCHQIMYIVRLQVETPDNIVHSITGAHAVVRGMVPHVTAEGTCDSCNVSAEFEFNSAHRSNGHLAAVRVEWRS